MEYRLDLSQYRCPLPILMTKRALKSLKAGEKLLLVTEVNVNEKELVLLCQEMGARLLWQQSDMAQGKVEWLIELQAVS
ncbi:sulfurtransferase TusA family protein [Glaesserella sp.]|uniref:sulfurtransferase TusA family protein n=1 Tax=Glaesserella sp. TaxID=2094731 RepID=UPI0035A192C3